MIFVVDTSSARSGLALLRQDGTVESEETQESGRSLDLPGRFRALTQGHTLTKIAVATGPGSFTGLRAGVSFGLGVAIGLGIPIVALKTLQIQAARSAGPAIAVAEAGRGRVYSLVPGADTQLSGPDDLPKDLRAVGWLRPSTESLLRSAGVAFMQDAELQSFGVAVSRMLESASEVAYGSLRLEYMQGLGSAIARNRWTRT